MTTTLQEIFDMMSTYPVLPRITAAVAACAWEVYAEESTVEGHQLRVDWARTVLQSDTAVEDEARRLKMTVLMHPDVQAGGFQCSDETYLAVVRGLVNLQAGVTPLATMLESHDPALFGTQE